MGQRPISGWSPSASGWIPWKASRAGPPHTTTSPLSSRTRRGRSRRCEPPNRNFAGRPSDRDHRCREVALVPVLMQREPRARLVAVDEARIGREIGEPGLVGGGHCDAPERRRHGRPGPSAQRIKRIVAVAAAIRDPAARAAIRHRDRCHLPRARGGKIPIRLVVPPFMVGHPRPRQHATRRDEAGNSAFRTLVPADVERRQLREELQLAVRQVIVDPPCHAAPSRRRRRGDRPATGSRWSRPLPSRHPDRAGPRYGAPDCVWLERSSGRAGCRTH